MPTLLLLGVLAAAPGAHRFLHLLDGAPVGVVELQRDGPRYRYLSQHFFLRGKPSQTRFESTAATTWASESLLTPRPPGCWPAEDELTRKQGEVCVTRREGPSSEGTLLGQAFTARYDGERLAELTLGVSRFVRSEAPVKFVDPFGTGFPLTGAGRALRLEPPVEGTRAVQAEPVGGAGPCLEAARQYVAAHPGTTVELGLIEDRGRAWPHAWASRRATGEAFDPSRPVFSAEAPRYLALPAERAGQVYLELLGGSRAVVRTGEAPGRAVVEGQ